MCISRIIEIEFQILLYKTIILLVRVIWEAIAKFILAIRATIHLSSQVSSF